MRILAFFLPLWLLAQQPPSDRLAALNERMSAMIRADTRPVDDAAMLAWMTSFAHRLDPNVEVELIVANDRSEAVFVPPARVFVPVHLISKSADERELAAMLAHALGHRAANSERTGWIGPGPRAVERIADEHAAAVLGDASFAPDPEFAAVKKRAYKLAYPLPREAPSLLRK